MKTFYSVLCSFLIVGSVFAQGVNSQKLKIAPKKGIDSTIPKVISNAPQLRSSTDCDPAYFYCENFEDVSIPNLPADMSTSSLEENYYVPVDGNNVQVQGFFTGTSEDAGVGGYWTYLDEHTTFAMTNDDSCLPGGATPGENNNCDLTLEILELPSLNFAEGDSEMWLQFKFFHDKVWGGGDAYVEISTDGGDNFSDLSGPLPETQAWQSGAFNLSDYYADTNVVIRFTWSDNGSWASGLAVDDIIVNPLPEYAIKLNEHLQLFPSAYFGGTTYQTVPAEQSGATAYNFAGYVKNMGLNTLDSARLYSSIAAEGFSSESFAENTVSLLVDSFYCNDVFTASVNGTYEAEIYASDENGTVTETKTVQFNVSDYEYARDDADFTGGYSGGSFVNSDGTEQRGNIYDIYKEAMLYGIKVRIHPATSPGCMAKGVLNMVDVETGDVSYLTETAEMNVGSMTDDWMNFVFDVPVQLMAGDVVLPTIYANYDAVDTLVIAQTGNSQPGETLLQDIDGVSGDPGEWYYTTSTAMVRLNFDPTLTPPASVNEENVIKFNVYPNPNNGIFNISAASNEKQEIEVQNVLGQVVYNQALNNGNTQIDLSNYDKGVYTISVTNENGLSSSKKIIIQ